MVDYDSEGKVVVSASIYFHPEAYSTSGRKLMGRNAAGESFLRGFFRYASEGSRLWAQVLEADHLKSFEETARGYGRDEEIVPITRSNLGALADARTAYHPGPGIGEHAVQRRFFGDDSWSLCGITHTTSSARAMDAIAELLIAPIQPWDAVICPSKAVKNNVENILRAHATYLQRRLGATKVVLPKLPVIPLGIHTEDFSFDAPQRAAARKRIKVRQDTVVVLYTGRLSFHAKANPIAMYQGLEYAARETGKEVVLIECGWHANEHIKSAFDIAAKELCPSVRVVHLDGRDAKNRDTSWASADVFCSLSDNIQETFGIVPIEAMAAGLPVVVSDWDGYRDSVRDGIDGFRIPTIAPGPGLAGDLAFRHAVEIDTYDMYCGHTSSLIGVDVARLSNAFLELISSRELRKKMGEAGKRRAIERYDWKQIIKIYEDLWSEQNAIRTSARSESPKSNSARVDEGWPPRLDPSIGFSAYPTKRLTEATELRPTFSTEEEAFDRIRRYKSLVIVNYASYVVPSEEDIHLIIRNTIRLLKEGMTVVPVKDVIRGSSMNKRPFLLRSLGWFVKIGLYSLE